MSWLSGKAARRSGKMGRALRSSAHSLLTAGIAFLVGISAANATTLVHSSNVTYDSNTKLEWLNVSLTTNLSYNYVVANLLGSGDPYYGWRYATVGDLATLFADAGVSQCGSGAYSCGVASPSELYPVSQLINDLGQTYSGGITREVQGLLGSGNATFRNVGEFYTVAPYGYMADANYGSVLWNSSDPSLGSFLVRTTPLPASLPLFAVGMIALSLLGWRRKRNATAFTA